MKPTDQNIFIYRVFRHYSRDEAVIWVLFFVVVAGMVGWSAFINDATLLFFSSMVLVGIIFSFVSDTLIDVRTKENLALAVSRMAQIVSEIQEGIMIYDNDFRILVVNKHAEVLLDVRADEVIGKIFAPASGALGAPPRLFQILFPSLAPMVTLRSAPGSYPNIIDIVFTDPPNVFRVYSNRLVDAQGRDLGFIKVIYDRTNEEAMLREKSEFITVAAHQLRTPLTAINWALESLERDTSMSQEGRSFVTAAAATAAKLSETVNDLLEAARIEGGKTEYRFEPIDLCPVLREALKEAEISAREHEVTLQSFLGEEPITVSGDSAKLRLAFLNLIENAIRYNIKGGSVRVTVTHDHHNNAEVTIQDTGLGIPKEDVHKLFTKFFRASNVAREVTEGSGLGLFITKGITEAHGGTIRVESELGKGSIFYITLPLAH